MVQILQQARGDVLHDVGRCTVSQQPRTAQLCHPRFARFVGLQHAGTPFDFRLGQGLARHQKQRQQGKWQHRSMSTWDKDLQASETTTTGKMISHWVQPRKDVIRNVQFQCSIGGAHRFFEHEIIIVPFRVNHHGHPRRRRGCHSLTTSHATVFGGGGCRRYARIPQEDCVAGCFPAACWE